MANAGLQSQLEAGFEAQRVISFDQNPVAARRDARIIGKLDVVSDQSAESLSILGPMAARVDTMSGQLQRTVDMQVEQFEMSLAKMKQDRERDRVVDGRHELNLRSLDRVERATTSMASVAQEGPSLADTRSQLEAQTSQLETEKDKNAELQRQLDSLKKATSVVSRQAVASSKHQERLNRR